MSKRRLFSSLTVLSMAASLLVFFAAPATAVSCTDQIEVLHRPSNAAAYRPLYTDWTKNMRSNFVGYRVKSGISGAYLKVTGLNAADLKIATKGYDTAEAVPTQETTLAHAGKKVGYFYLTAVRQFTAQSTFAVTLYQGGTSTASPGTEVCTITDGFSNTENVIAANPNTITSISVSNNAPTSGQTVVVTAVGQTGTMGNPSTDKLVPGDKNSASVFLTSLSMLDTWDASNFLLQGMEIRASAPKTTVGYDRVRYYFTPTDMQGEYSVKYTVKLINPGPAALRPVQVIASGNEYKYTGSYPASSINLGLAGASSVDITKELLSVEATTSAPTDFCEEDGPCYQAFYQVTVTNPGGALTNVVVVDRPSALAEGATWVYGDDGEKDTVTLVDVDLPTVDSTSITFQPFALGASGSTVFTYSLFITGAVKNTVSATIDGGSDVFESNSTTALVEITTKTLPPANDGSDDYEVTLEQDGGTACEWSVVWSEPSPEDWLEVTEAGVLRVRDGESAVAGTYTFTVTTRCTSGGITITDTQELTLTVGDISIVTTSLPNVCAGDTYNRTLEASEDSGISWSIISGSLPNSLTLDSATGQITGRARTEGLFTFTVALIAGATTTTKELSIRVVDCRSGQVITFPPVGNKTWGDPNPSSSPTASSGLPVMVTNNTPDVCTFSGGVITILKVGTCSLTATQPGDTYNWDPAVPVTMSFVIAPAPVTVAAENKQKVEEQADPACTYAVTGLVKGDTASGLSCTRVVGEAIGSYAITPAGGNFSANYRVAYVNGTLTIVAGTPKAPGAGTYTPVSMKSSTITWGPSATSGVTYEAYYNGQLVCSTTATSCEANRIIGPASKVNVLAVRLGLKSPLVDLRYKYERPIAVVTVYFNVDSSVINRTDRREVLRVANILKREGFGRFTVRGYTDADASAAYNLALSNRRSAALRALAKTVLDEGRYSVTGRGFEDPAASNATPKGKSLNRRSVLFITG